MNSFGKRNDRRRTAVMDLLRQELELCVGITRRPWSRSGINDANHCAIAYSDQSICQQRLGREYGMVARVARGSHAALKIPGAHTIGIGCHRWWHQLSLRWLDFATCNMFCKPCVVAWRQGCNVVPENDRTHQRLWARVYDG